MLKLALFLHLVAITYCKPYKLSVLGLSFLYSEDAPSIVYKSCTNSAKFAAEWANNDSQILPDYQIEVEFHNEGTLGSKVAENIIGYKRRFLNLTKNEEDNNYPSPVSIGPWYTPGCAAAGKFLHHMDQVMLSTLCSGAMLPNRNVYPNLFLIASTSNYQTYGYVKFVREVGNWTKVALLTFPGNSNDFSAALNFQRIASQQGMQLLWFDSLTNFDMSKARSLKDSHARIIVVMSTDTRWVVNFYCNAYKAGIKGSRYVFVAAELYYDFNDPNFGKGYSDCSNEVIYEQVERSFLFGQKESGDANIKTSLGYTRKEFDQMLNQYLVDKEGYRYDDWARYLCHDAMLQLITILKDSEEELKNQSMSLRDYGRDPKKVMEVVYNKALNVEYMGTTMANKFHYSDANEPDGRPFFLTRFINKASVKLVQFDKVGKVTKYGNFKWRLVRDIPWRTTDGKPPKDFWTVVSKELKLSDTEGIVVKCIAGVLAALQIVTLFYAIFKKKILSNYERFPRLKVIGLIICIVLSITAIIFAHDYTETVSQTIIWHVRIILTAISLSMIFQIPTYCIMISFRSATNMAKTRSVHWALTPAGGRAQSKPSSARNSRSSNTQRNSAGILSQNGSKFSSEMSIEIEKITLFASSTCSWTVVLVLVFMFIF